MKIVCNSKTTRKPIVKLIRQMMIEQDVKRVQMAQRIGGHDTTVYNLLNPDYRPDNTITVETLVKLCDAMDCELVLEIRRKERSADDVEFIS